ncbi:High-affinity nicotinic acid transporter [Pseudocercospora fuligena]|uniref:High-affinity nicotinic acid transporter n=1 Tax=Pseudocercospora fuligena TaxID=685502 RepID=A0A8H6RFY5_9PEZI|nr:High-affinity nicotinic acid transporter [Pseudocercospora fuligena]
MSKANLNTVSFSDDRKYIDEVDHAAKHSSSASSDQEKQVQEGEPLDVDPVYSLREQRKIIHKVDRRLVYILGLMYCVSLMDRVNLPNAAIAGMNVDLDMNKGFRYSTVGLVFFITYTLFQPPATILTRKLGPRLFLPGLCVAWGAVMVGFGFVHKWTTLIPLRLILGLFEAGYFPGCVYLLSAWYARYDQQRRFALFYLLGLAAAGASGILAYGVSKMDGLADHAGWRWIFIMYGIITMVLGVLGYIFVVDFPDRCKEKKHWGFLTNNEIDFIIRRINKDRGDAVAEPWDFQKWIACGADPKVWSFALLFFCATSTGYGISFFLPIILRQNMGYSIALSQVLSAPQYIYAAILCYVFAWFGDRYRIRGPLLFLNALQGFIGLPLLGFAKSPGVRYFSTFLIAGGAHAAIPTIMAYQANNIRGHWKRAFTSATLIGFGGIGGIAGSLMFRTRDAPKYHMAVYLSLAFNSLIVVLVCINTVYFRYENRKADRGEKVLEGDVNFRYTI